MLTIYQKKKRIILKREIVMALKSYHDLMACSEMFTSIYLNAREVNTNLTISMHWVKDSNIF